MRIRAFFLFTAVFILSIPLVSRAAEPSLFAGTGKSQIVVPAGTPLAGYGKRHGKPSTGTHDSLYARALSLRRGDKTFVFISADLVLIDAGLRKAVIKKLLQTENLKPDQVLISATHTHSGPGAYGDRFWERFIMGKFRKEVFREVVDALSNAATQSLRNQVPVAAEFGEMRIDELVENRMDEKFNLPDRFRILRFKNSSGDVKASMIFMAAHATLLPASNRELSADFPGLLTESMEKKFPGSVSLFLNGAAGDLRPKAPDIENRMERMAAYVRMLDEKTEGLSFSPVNLDGPWGSAIERIKLPRTKVYAGAFRFPSWIGGRMFPRHAEFQAIRTGPFLFLAFPAEVGSETGRDIERQAAARGYRPFFIGYANDYTGYVVPRRYYEERSNYESRASFYGGKMDWFIQKKSIALADRLLTPEEKANSNLPGHRLEIQGLPVLILRGDAYHAGYEEGRLMREEIRKETDSIMKYLRSQAPVPGINRLAFRMMLNRAWKKMEPHVSYEEVQQMRGIADGSGVPFGQIKRMHALPEVYPAWCTNGAYWGDATAGGRMIAVRNLDWNREMGIHRYAAVKVIATPGRLAYANIGYAGFSGVLTGVNEKGISTGEVGAVSTDESIKGLPMPFLLKRIMQDAGSIDEALEIFRQNKLTRGYNYILADALAKKAVAIEATRSHLAVFQDHDPKELEISYALPIKNAVFRGDPALDPGIRDLQTASKGDPKKPGLEPPAGSAYEIRYRKHGQLVLDHYGRIDAETAKAIARETAPGSNIQSVVFAFPEFFVANAREDKKAAETEYVELNFEKLSQSASS